MTGHVVAHDAVVVPIDIFFDGEGYRYIAVQRRIVTYIGLGLGIPEEGRFRGAKTGGVAHPELVSCFMGYNQKTR